MERSYSQMTQLHPLAKHSSNKHHILRIKLNSRPANSAMGRSYSQMTQLDP